MPSLFFPEPRDERLPEWFKEGAVLRFNERTLLVNRLDRHCAATLTDVNTREGRKTDAITMLQTGRVEFTGEWAKIGAEGYISERKFTTFNGLYQAIRDVAQAESHISIICADDEENTALGWNLFMRAGGRVRDWSCKYKIGLWDLRLYLDDTPQPVIAEYVKSFSGRCKLGVAMLVAAREDEGVGREYVGLADMFRKLVTDPPAPRTTWAERLVREEPVQVEWSTVNGNLIEDF